MIDSVMGTHESTDAAPLTDLRQATRDNFEYLVATLSRRTTGKKYENYVVNAIWNALSDETLRPVTQQYVNRRVQRDGLALVNLAPERTLAESKQRAYIDLYFPALRLGIECDEAQHDAQDPEAADDARRQDIERAIPGYREERVRVQTDETGKAVSPATVLERIDKVVAIIRERKSQVERGDFEWALAGPVAWPLDVPDWQLALRAGALRAADGFFFRSNGEVRELFGRGNGTGTGSDHFTTNIELTGSSDVVWCPTLAVHDPKTGFRTTNTAGWLNWIMTEGDEVLIGQAAPSEASAARRKAASLAKAKPLPAWEYGVPADVAAQFESSIDREPVAWTPDGHRWDGARRITFVRTKDAIGRRGFQFVGVFSAPIGHRAIDGVWFEVCRLVSDSVQLPRLGAPTR
ncbi:hypothetical protein I8920_09645 [Curtobacterium sp. YC1]|uniref:AbaSI family restriction endonuclease n=1 Tax=Curtobacterium sp. YC1 TaxID=2795488 RepID=UPI0018E54EE3|nr:hypothetical protein [Curtobacterium sp. YC1]QQD75132.1 hypothetical protein I8920_09645 [Curtobacterium sp. YC1]